LRYGVLHTSYLRNLMRITKCFMDTLINHLACFFPTWCHVGDDYVEWWWRRNIVVNSKIFVHVPCETVFCNFPCVLHRSISASRRDNFMKFGMWPYFAKKMRSYFIKFSEKWKMKIITSLISLIRGNYHCKL